MSPQSKKKDWNLTKKEIKVIQLICKQYTNQDIADNIGLSKRTVDGIRIGILNKIRVKNTAGVVIFAIRQGIYKI